jgi:hypothetical protein
MNNILQNMGSKIWAAKLYRLGVFCSVAWQAMQ